MEEGWWWWGGGFAADLRYNAEHISTTFKAGCGHHGYILYLGSFFEMKGIG